NLSDSLHWNEPPVPHVLGRDIALERYVEPRVRTELATIRWRAQAAARSLDLRGKRRRPGAKPSHRSKSRTIRKPGCRSPHRPPLLPESGRAMKSTRRAHSTSSYPSIS